MARRLEKQREDPEFLRKIDESHDTPEYRELQRLSLVEKKKSAKWIENQAESSRTPERRELARQQMFKNNQDPEFVEKKVEAVKQVWQDPEFRKRNADANVLKSGMTPETREILRKNLEIQKRDPEFRHKMAVGHARRVDYNGPKGCIPMKAGWEPNFAARIMDLCEFDWTYEPVTFDMNFEEVKLPSYTPDFWVPELNCFIEIKGQNPEYARVRAQICELLHGVRIIVLDGPTLKLLGLWSKAVLDKNVLIEKLKAFSLVKVA